MFEFGSDWTFSKTPRDTNFIKKKCVQKYNKFLFNTYLYTEGGYIDNVTKIKINKLFLVPGATVPNYKISLLF